MLWIKLCAQLLELTGEATYAEHLERTLYNAFLGSMAPDGSWYARHNPLAGVRDPEERHQVGMRQNCCVANGPRVMLLIPELVIMAGPNGPVVNLYCEGSYRLRLSGGAVITIEQQTRYPEAGHIRLILTPGQPAHFELALRIPAWCVIARVRVRGTETAQAPPGAYLRITRTWHPGDVVELDFPMPLQRVPAGEEGQAIALRRGPIVLASDRRLAPDGRDPVAALPVGTPVSLTRAVSPSGDLWMTFAARFSDGSTLRLCDFASANNTWDDRSRYRAVFPASHRLLPIAPPASGSAGGLGSSQVE